MRAALGVLLAAGLGGAQDRPVKLPDLQQVLDRTYGFSLKLPKGWDRSPPDGTASIHAYTGVDPGPGGVTVIAAPPLPGFLEGKKTWDDVLKAHEALMKAEGAKDYTLVKREELACGKAPGLLFVWRFKQDGVEMSGTSYLVMTPQRGLQFLWVCRGEVRAACEPMFDALCREIRLVEPGAIPPAPAPKALVPAKPVESKVSLAAPKKTTLDTQWVRLGLDAPKLQPNLRLSGDGRHLFALDQGGALRKIALPACVEELRLDLPASAASLQRSKLGLLVAVPEANQMWILDEATLAVKTRVDVPRIAEIASSPALPTAYVRTGSSELAIVDLQKGAVAKLLNARDVWEAARSKVKKPADPKGLISLSDFRAPAVSPDGKWLFCLSGGLVRFAIRGQDLVCEEIGPSMGGSRVEISPDSAAVAVLPCERGIIVYKTTDLQKAVSTLKLRSDPAAVAWNPTTKKLYAHDESFQLVVHGAAKEAEYPLSGPYDRTRQIVVHPGGKAAAILTAERLLWVEFGAAEPVKGTALPRRGSVIELGAGFFKILPVMRASGDGRRVFTLEENGTVRRIHVPEFVQTAQAATDERALGMERSARGLLVLASKTRRLFVLDETTLAVASTIPLPDVTSFAASPALDVAFAVRGNDVQVVDLVKGAVVKTLTPAELWTSHDLKDFELQSIAASPDGKWLAAIQGARFSRFAIQGQALVHQDMGPRVVSHRNAVPWFSADSKYLAAAASNIVEDVPGHVRFERGGTYLYAVSDLQKPAASLACASPPWALDLDARSGTVYSGGQDVHLTSFGLDGLKRKDYGRILSGKPQQILAHPDGALLLDQGRLFWVER